MTEIFDKKFIANNITKLRGQHEIAEKQCLQLIIKNKFAFDGELDRYNNVFILMYIFLCIFFVFLELEFYKMI